VARCALAARLRWSTTHALARWAARPRLGKAARGRAGEELAARALTAGGVRLIGRRLRCGPAEIDLAGLESSGIVVVFEVKAGRVPASGALRHRPGAHLGPAQLARLERAARALTKARGARGWRVELVEVLLHPAEAQLTRRTLVSNAPPVTQ
jgi:Holliday junction resolvase-like predicted endonuclease